MLGVLQGMYLELDRLEIARLVFVGFPFAGEESSCGDLFVDFVVWKEAFSGLEDLASVSMRWRMGMEMYLHD
jgi:hypothetical protein